MIIWGLIGGLTAGMVICAKNFLAYRTQKHLKGSKHLVSDPLSPILPTEKCYTFKNEPQAYGLSTMTPAQQASQLGHILHWEMTTVGTCFKNNGMTARILLDLLKKLQHKGHIAGKTLDKINLLVKENPIQNFGRNLTSEEQEVANRLAPVLERALISENSGSAVYQSNVFKGE